MYNQAKEMRQIMIHLIYRHILKSQNKNDYYYCLVCIIDKFYWVLILCTVRLRQKDVLKLEISSSKDLGLA